MRTLLAALTALMLFATPVVAGDYEDAVAAYKAGEKRDQPSNVVMAPVPDPAIVANTSEPMKSPS